MMELPCKMAVGQKCLSFLTIRSHILRWHFKSKIWMENTRESNYRLLVFPRSSSIDLQPARAVRRDKKVRKNSWVKVLRELMHGTNLAIVYLVLGCTANFAAWNDIFREQIYRKGLSMCICYDKCVVSALFAAWSCARPQTTELN